MLGSVIPFETNFDFRVWSRVCCTARQIAFEGSPLRHLLIRIIAYFRQSSHLGFVIRWRWSSLLTALSLVSCAMPPSSSVVVQQNTADWVTLTPGLERRLLRPGVQYPFSTFVAIRIEMANFTFRAHYRPGEPLALAEWQTLLGDPAVIVNTNFFDLNNQILGVLVSDGVVYGQAYRDRGGLVQLQDGVARVRSTITEPYQGEALEQAVQAFPMLVTDGAASFYNTRGDRISRRTVIGQDAQGRLILIASSSLFGMTLVDLSAYLAGSDLGLVNAINFDGGGSTLMSVNVPDSEPTSIFSFDAVPAVLAIYPR